MQRIVVIKTLLQLEELKQVINDHEFIAYDVETTGVIKDSNIIGFSFAFDCDTGYYVVVSSWDPTLQKLVDLETKAAATELLSLLIGKSIICHNAGFDAWMTANNYNVELIKYIHTDTMLLAHLLNENRKVGLKELSVSIFGEDSKDEQRRMKESVKANGGVMTKALYEMYKCDTDIMAEYGAKDAILTMKLFYFLLEDLHAQGLEKFFYEDETMPLLRGLMYDLNTTGLRVDLEKLKQLKFELETENLELEAFINAEIKNYVKGKYPGKKKADTFNFGSSQQLAWLLFDRLGKEFGTLTDGGKGVAKFLGLRLPYSFKDKAAFRDTVKNSYDQVYAYNGNKPKKITHWYAYLQCGKDILIKYAKEYKWVEAILKHKRNEKLLSTYVEGIQSRVQYGVIRPNFLQHGTTSGRLSCRNPNFQNLPRDDKRIKACLIARPGNVFVGSDFSQLEPRVFASFSGDTRLLECFKSGQDFYSVIGMEVFDKYDCTPFKEGPDAFGVKYKKLRDISKAVALSATYGTTAPKMAMTTGKTIEEAQEVIDSYFEKFPSVQKMMLQSHEDAKKHGEVKNLFGRPRRMPEAMNIQTIYGRTPHAELPYNIRNTLNLAVNHRIQSTGASIINRASIQFCKYRDELNLSARIVNQIHDEIIIECAEDIAEEVKLLLQRCMETAVELPGISLEAKPTIAHTIADLK